MAPVRHYASKANVLTGQAGYEFPRFDFSYCPPIPAGWRECSWHNDAMPFWLIDDRTGIFVDYFDKDLGDFPDVPDWRWFRYQVCRMEPDPQYGPQHPADGGDSLLLATNDWEAVLTFVAARCGK